MSLEKHLDEISAEIVNIVKKKNQDYGNSFEKMIDKYGWVALLIRFQDKTGRLDNLILENKEGEVSDESIEDTLMDIAGYALLALAVRKKQKGTTITATHINWGKLESPYPAPTPYHVPIPKVDNILLCNDPLKDLHGK